ncbi:MAG TPA: PilW family protein, partial [Thermoanaerobaculia bacterium]|nr:PilW family protein [Thermoanaerobaculia bacterium]
IRDPDSGAWDIQPVVAEVEDFQVAYGVDGVDGSARDQGVDPGRVVRSVGGDEWVYDFPGETLAVSANPTRVDAFVDTSVPSAPPNLAPASSALKEIMLSLLVRSSVPESEAQGPGSWGQKLLDSTALPLSSTTPYKRRSQTAAVALRNYL